MSIPRRTFLASSLALAASTFARSNQQAGNEETQTRRREQLQRHRIADLQVLTVQMHYPRLVGKNARLDVHGRGPRVTVCRLRTDQGASGWGVFSGNEQRGTQLLERYRNRRISEVFDPATGITDRELAPLDFALHDLAGVILQIPVYEMLGSRGPESSPYYSGMIYFDDLEPPKNTAGIDRVLENCRWDHNYGYRQLKVKIGRGHRWMDRQAGIRRDIEVTRAIARAFPDVRILVDANDGYTPEDFFTYLEGIGDIELLWIEEPFRENVQHFQRLHDWLRSRNRQTFLADGEANPDWDVLNELSRRHLLDVQLVDIQGYGFTAWRRLMPELVRLRVQASPHAWGNLLKSYYSSHLARGLGNVVTIEGVTCTCEEVDFGQYTLRDGRLTPPNAPGFGMRLNVR